MIQDDLGVIFSSQRLPAVYFHFPNPTDCTTLRRPQIETLYSIISHKDISGKSHKEALPRQFQGSSSRDGPFIKPLKGSKRSSILRMSGEPDGGITHFEEVVCLTNIWEWDSNLWSSPL
ncbi:hypothetical protein CEXT_2111 [Caerostris extrusa]|uniref:Ycf15 n=1 Tax=Caerostris extrusa TaxID=172846 RepID=A0AAV4UZI3_CAEEX|nr:hypothetical protein CEXT_2111 [Caerostris extrusa]